MKIKKWIEVSLQKEGIHCYPDAKTDPSLIEVSYLSNPHRHVFHVYVKIEIYHNNRDIEFILFKKEILEYLDTLGDDFNFKSCEMIASDILAYLDSKYPNRSVEIRVYEDNENGAILNRDF